MANVAHDFEVFRTCPSGQGQSRRSDGNGHAVVCAVLLICAIRRLEQFGPAIPDRQVHYGRDDESVWSSFGLSRIKICGTHQTGTATPPSACVSTSIARS